MSDPVPIGACQVDPRAAVAFVGSGRANEPAPRLSSAARVLTSRLVDTNAPVAVVSTSSSPGVVFEGTMGSNAANDVALDADRAAAPDVVQTAIQARPSIGEVDLVGALLVAARWVNAHGGGSIIVTDSGLSTAGPVDYSQPGVLAAAPGEVAAFLRRQAALPPLEGITVAFTGLGDTADPQSPLPERFRRALTAQYLATARAGTADCVAVDPTPVSGAATPGAPRVALVAAPKAPTFTGGTVVLDESQLAFQPGKAVFASPTEATATLSSLVPTLAATTAIIEVTGTTADWGSQQYQRRLARARCLAVTSALQRLGIPRERMRVIALGSDNPWHVPDHAEDGSLLPGPAARNRSVRLTLT
jgi:outer membrane protein OmpA-like peptidoglycan-associated protein